MERLIERLLERTGLTEDDLTVCGSVNLPDAAQPFLDLTPAQVLAALRSGDLDSLADSKTVWFSGWEPSEKLRQLLAALRGILNSRPSPPSAGAFYRHAGDQLKARGRIRHAQLLKWSDPGAGEPTTCFTQRLALKLRGKLKGSAGSAPYLDVLRKEFNGGSDESS